jgi:hypothetical protein
MGYKYHVILLLFLTACQFFQFLLTTYVQYNFYMRMSRTTSSHFAKYFCDTYFEDTTPFTVMTYATFDAIRVIPPQLLTLRSRAMVWSG